MEPAETGEVREVGGSAVLPVPEVVEVAPVGGGVAAGEDTPAVAGVGGASLGSVGVTLGAPEVEGDPVG